MHEPDCPFCTLPAGRITAENEHAFCLLDGFPLTEGHMLVVPRRHVANLFDLGEQELAAVWRLVAEVHNRLRASDDVHGVNVGLNDGRAAGQTIEHAHVHVIPRREGDVPDPRGGVRWVLPERARYWEDGPEG